MVGKQALFETLSNIDLSGQFNETCLKALKLLSLQLNFDFSFFTTLDKDKVLNLTSSYLLPYSLEKLFPYNMEAAQEKSFMKSQSKKDIKIYESNLNEIGLQFIANEITSYNILQTLYIPFPICENLYGACLLFRKNREFDLELEIVNLKLLSSIFSLMFSKNIILNERDSISKELDKQKMELDLIIDSVQAIIFFKDINSKLIKVNKSYVTHLGITPEMVCEKTDYDIFPEADANRFSVDDRKVIENGERLHDIIQLIQTPLGQRWLQTDKVPHRDIYGNIIGLIGMSVDITKLKLVEHELQSSNRALEGLINESPSAILKIDPYGIINMSNPAAVRLFGMELKIGKDKFVNLVDASNTNLFLEAFEKVLKGVSVNGVELKCKGENNKLIHISVSMASVLGQLDIVEYIIAVISDITEKTIAFDQIKYLSYNDKLTGLFNRAYFEEQLILIKKKAKGIYSFIMGDLNGLKITNDVFGHFEGDKLLKIIADVLKRCCGKGDIISRWGGDEFAILIANSSQAHAEEICSNIRAACEKIEESPVKPSISLGVITIDVSKENINAALKEAEDRMYRNKLLQSRSARNAIISSLEQTLSEKSNETEEHTQRMREVCRNIGQEIGLSDEKLEELELLATLHDIGKIAIPDEILIKPSALDRDEWITIKRHPEIGFRIAESSLELSHIAEAILSHHERYDGIGYPRGLSGEQIPILARIVAVADAFDVMTHSRPYKKPKELSEAIKELEVNSGKQFDPVITSLIIKILAN